MSDSSTDPGHSALSPARQSAALAQSNDLIAFTDAVGMIVWANPRFTALTGLAADGSTPIEQLAADAHAAVARDLIAHAICGDTLDRVELVLRAADGAALHVVASTLGVDDWTLWTLRDCSREHTLADALQRKTELLDMAQQFGRIGVWERRIPSGEGRWDAHVFGFWGLDPSHGTPSYEDAIQRIHPEDRAALSYRESTQQAGRYAQRYRVLHTDGSTRWIHSQWEVKPSPQGRPDRAIGIMMDDTAAFDAARVLVDVNAQLEMAVDLGHIAIWRHDLKTQLIHYNPSAFALIGMPVRQEGFPISETRALIHPDDLPVVLASAEASLRSAHPIDVEARYRHADGSWRYVLTRRVVQHGANGEPLAFVGVALDITHRVEHLRHAEELARRLDAAAHAARLGIWTATAGTLETDWNAQMFELFDRVDGTRPPSLLEWLRDGVHPDDQQRVSTLAGRCMGDRPGPFEMEFRTLRRDGRTRWIVMRADVDRSRSDQRRLLGVALDVTEQRETLDALRDASERSALITSHAGIGTWESGPDGLNERWDDQMFKLRGMAPQAALPERAERMSKVHPADIACILENQLEMADASGPGGYEFRVLWPDGKYRWLASRSVAIVDDDGTIRRRVGVNWDVTESRNAELARQQAAVAERDMLAKSRFLSRMSHELRTPMNAVLGFTQLLQIEAGRAGARPQIDKLAHIRTAADHLLSLINDVLELSGLESGEMKLALQTVDLAQLIADSLPLLESMADQQQIPVHTGTIGGSVVADPTRLRQVLINLLSNAIKYNRPGGQVVVETRVEGERVGLVVRDTGRGLDTNQLAHMFEPFNRFGVEREGIEGTGIGLTIVKTLVDGMQGSIDVTSVRGAGSTFTVWLPVSKNLPTAIAPAIAIDPPSSIDTAEDAVENAASSLPALPSVSQRKRAGRLLYIEDNAVNVLLVEELVRSLAGLAIDSEPTGAAGVARAIEQQPDLILVDLQLPDFDGFEVLRRLRASPVTRAIPCIALSANAMPEDIARGMDAGFTDYWTKPINFNAFLAALGRIFPAEPARIEA